MWITNASIVDVRTGSVREGRAVEVVDGLIAAETESAPGATGEIDLRGAFLLPGLVSVHTHLSVVYPFSDTDEAEPSWLTVLRSLRRAEDALRAGVTTLRCVHEQHRAELLLREAARRSLVRVPRIFGAGRAVSTTGGHGHGMACAYADGADEFLKAARTELAAGADHVKIFITGGIADVCESLGAQMTGDEMAAAVTAAVEHGTYVVAHAGSADAIRVALAAGVRCFEHAYELDAETAQAMRHAGAYLTPTLCVTRSPEWMADHHFSREQIERALEVGPRHHDSIRRAIDAGVPLLNGTDYPPGEPIDDTVVAVRELELMVEAGLSPLAALQGATTIPASLLGGADDFGAVEVGLAADLVSVPRNPLEDVTALRGIDLVLQGGRVVRDDRGDLDDRDRRPR